MKGFPERAAVVRRFIGRNAPLTPDKEATVNTICERIDTFVQADWTMRAWHPTTPGSPCAVSVDGYPGMKEWDHQLVCGWMDHAYRLIKPDGTPIFVSEPYGIDGGALIRLQYLHTNGWQVAIRPDKALHYPGLTVAIWITKARAAS